jgi:hypothetical protein
MSTRALICYLDEDNVLTSTYNHYDGYDSGVGAALRAHYTMKIAKPKKLLM